MKNVYETKNLGYYDLAGDSTAEIKAFKDAVVAMTEAEHWVLITVRDDFHGRENELTTDDVKTTFTNISEKFTSKLFPVALSKLQHFIRKCNQQEAQKGWDDEKEHMEDA